MRTPESRPQVFGRHFYGLSLVAAIVTAAGFCTPVSAQTLSAAEAASKDAAVIEARAGNYVEALATLESLLADNPDDLALAHDYVTVLAWSEDDARAVEFAETLNASSAPIYTQLAVAKSARNLRQFGLAAVWYDAALNSTPDNVDALAGRLMTAVDAGDTESILSLTARIDAIAEPGTELSLARAYALAAAGESLPALTAYDDLLATQPDNRDALRGKALVLRSMLLPSQALAMAAEHPGILSDDEIERLRSDETAIRIRMTARTPYPAATIYESLDRSLAILDEQLAEVTTEAGRDALLLDRVVALSDANEAEAAIAQFEMLPATANTDQAYVLAAAARAYLQAERPEDALRLLQRALELDPGNISVRFGLVYTWLDLDRYDEASAMVDALNGELPMTNQSAAADVIKGNEDRMRSEVLAVIADAYSDQLLKAQTRLENLLDEAPNNPDLRQELANVYRWRGWLDRSLAEYRQVITNNDDLLGAQIGHAHASIDARDYEAVDAFITNATTNYGREPAVQELAERWAIHNESELNISATTGDSSGPITGSDYYSIDASWFTAPINYRYRVFATVHEAYAEFPEGESRRQRAGAGIEYRAPRLRITGSVSGSRKGDRDPGAAGTVEYRYSDFWTMGGGVEWNSDDVQLRAHRLGIEADRIFAEARYAPNELASVDFGIDHADYSDGNVLASAYADGRYRFMNGSRSKLDATGTIALGVADTDSVPYFSPTSSGSVTLGLQHEFRYFRRYSRQLTHVAGAETGRYKQSGFDAGSIWSIRYRIDWSLNDRLSLSFGAERHGQIFDGVREHTTVGTLAVHGRF